MPNSAALRQKAPVKRRPIRAPKQNRLRIVREEPTLKKRSPLVAKLFAAALTLVALIVSPLLINTQLAVISYQIHDDQVQLAQIREDNQRVQSQVNLNSSPERVRKAALDAGYVPAGETGYVTLKSSKIEGGTPPISAAKE